MMITVQNRFKQQDLGPFQGNATAMTATGGLYE